MIDPIICYIPEGLALNVEYAGRETEESDEYIMRFHFDEDTIDFNGRLNEDDSVTFSVSSSRLSEILDTYGSDGWVCFICRYGSVTDIAQPMRIPIQIKRC